MARVTSIEKNCENCNSSFDTLDVRKRFCTQSCAASFNNRLSPKRTKTVVEKTPRKSKVQQWLDGEFDGTVKAGLSAVIRVYLLAESGYRCQSVTCSVPGGWSGVNPTSGLTTLTVDHIDGNPYNNKQENLVVLCPNCHSLTPTYGALNRGSGRSARYVGVV